MKPLEIVVSLNKKLGANYNSFGLSYTVKATLEPGEKYESAIIKLDNELRELIGIRLPGNDLKGIRQKIKNLFAPAT